MSIVFFDSFGNASLGSHSTGSPADDLRAMWRGGSVTITELADLAEGRRCYAEGIIGSNLKPQHASVIGEIGFGFRLWLNDVAADRNLGELRDQGGLDFCNFGFDASDDTLVVYLNSGGDPQSGVVSRTSVSLSAGVYHYVELRIKLSNTVGEVHWQIDGTPAGSDTGLDTIRVGAVAQPIEILFMPNNTIDWNILDRLADIYVQDYADALLGITEVWYQPADTAGLSADFTPSTGSNHENVDDIGNDGDSTHNESSTPGDRDSFAHSDVVSQVPTAVQVFGMLKTQVVPNADARIGMRSGATDALGATTQLPETFLSLNGPIEEDDPDTASPWTLAGLNAAESVVEVV